MKPILFNTDMVRAILDGRKTQTRRVIKEIHTSFNHIGDFIFQRYLEHMNKKTQRVELKCPYGKIGDKLWVRETFAYCEDMGILDADGNPADHIYKADEPWDIEWGGKWTPSIFMPRELSRLTLEITNIRVERVQDITFADCCREGLRADDNDNRFGESVMFEKLWNSINEKRGYGWDKNPWVWVIEFKEAN